MPFTALYCDLMKRLQPTVLLTCLFLLPALHAAEKLYETGKVLHLEEKTHSRVLYYQVNTPVTREDPYFEISVQVKDTVYQGEYTPRHKGDVPPGEWMVPAAEVRIRLDKRYMFVTRPEGDELQFVITKRGAAAAPASTDSSSKK